MGIGRGERGVYIRRAELDSPGRSSRFRMCRIWVSLASRWQFGGSLGHIIDRGGGLRVLLREDYMYDGRQARVDVGLR